MRSVYVSVLRAAGRTAAADRADAQEGAIDTTLAAFEAEFHEANRHRDPRFTEE